MGKSEASVILNESFPVEVRSYFVPTLNRAYELVKDCRSHNSFLQGVIGGEAIPTLRFVAVEYCFQRLLDSGVLPLTYNVASNASDNYHHIEIFSADKRCILTAHQVGSPGAVPRKAHYRNKNSLHNYQCWLPTLGINPDTESAGPFYVLLTHGAQGDSLAFARMGMPEPLVNGWISQPVDLLREPHRVIEAERAIEEVTTDDLDMEFREYVIMRRSDKNAT